MPTPEQTLMRQGAERRERPRPLTRLGRRWPTVLALVSAALIGAPGIEGGRELLVLLAVEYLLIAAIGARWATWPILAALTALVVLLSMQDTIPAGIVLVAVAAVALAAGLLRDGTERRELGIQALGVLVFGGLALVAALVGDDAAAYVLAVGWLGHGAWDFVHLWRDRAVTRAYAEWCGVLDVLIAGTLLASA